MFQSIDDFRQFMRDITPDWKLDFYSHKTYHKLYPVSAPPTPGCDIPSAQRSVFTGTVPDDLGIDLNEIYRTLCARFRSIYPDDQGKLDGSVSRLFRENTSKIVFELQGVDINKYKNYDDIGYQLREKWDDLLHSKFWARLNAEELVTIIQVELVSWDEIPVNKFMMIDLIDLENWLRRRKLSKEMPKLWGTDITDYLRSKHSVMIQRYGNSLEVIKKISKYYDKYCLKTYGVSGVF